MPAVVYTMFGGVQAVTWTDVKIMVLIVFGLFAVIVGGGPRLSRRRQPRRRPRHRRRDRTAADVRLLVRPHQPVHVLVGHDRGAVSLLLVLRHRSEPGAALPDRAVGRRGAALAADERLLEDSAAGARAAARRARLRVLRVQSAAAALQPGPRRAHADGRSRRRPTRRCRRSSTPRSRRGATAAADLAAARDVGRRRRAWRPRRRALRAARGGAAVGARQRPRTSCARARRPHASPTSTTSSRRSSSRSCRSGSIGLLILAIIMAATDTIAGELNSLSTATVIDFYKRRAAPDGDRRALPDACRRSRPACGGCSPARWRSGRRSSAR